MGARGDDGERADRAAAGDEHALAQQRAGARHRVQGDGERLGKGGFVDRDAVADLVALPRLGNEALAEGALNVRESAWRCRRSACSGNGSAGRADSIRRRCRAGSATWRRGRRPRDPDTFAPDRLDRARDLVAENHRLANPHRAEAAMVEVVQIGAADAAGFDGHLDLAGPTFSGSRSSTRRSRAAWMTTAFMNSLPRCPRSQAGGDATVDVQRMPFDERRCISRQKHRRAGQFVDIAPSRDRRPAPGSARGLAYFPS